MSIVGGAPVELGCSHSVMIFIENLLLRSIRMLREHSVGRFQPRTGNSPSKSIVPSGHVQTTASPHPLPPPVQSTSSPHPLPPSATQSAPRPHEIDNLRLSSIHVREEEGRHRRRVDRRLPSAYPRPPVSTNPRVVGPPARPETAATARRPVRAALSVLSSSPVTKNPFVEAASSISGSGRTTTPRPSGLERAILITGARR